MGWRKRFQVEVEQMQHLQLYLMTRFFDDGMSILVGQIPERKKLA